MGNWWSGTTKQSDITKVYIWYPSWNEKQLGHASLTLNDGTHISWWPTGKIQGKKSKKNPREVGPLEEDIKLEGRKPDKTFEVTGLDGNRIKRWWEDWLDAGENEPRREKTGFLHMRKQRRRSASR